MATEDSGWGPVELHGSERSTPYSGWNRGCRPAPGSRLDLTEGHFHGHAENSIIHTGARNCLGPRVRFTGHMEFHISEQATNPGRRPELT